MPVVSYALKKCLSAKMIEIDFSTFICYYLLGAIVVILIFWLFDIKSQLKKRSLDTHCVWQCSICTYVYFDPRSGNISSCPVCGSFNKRIFTKKED